MLKFLALLILINISLQARIDPFQKDYQNLLTNKEGFGKLLLELSEMKVQTGGPIDDIEKIINNLTGDIQSRQGVLDQEYQEQSSQHEGYQRNLRIMLQHGQIDLADSNEYLTTTLQKQQIMLREDLVQYNQELNANEASMDQATTNRQLTHRAFLELVDSHQDAITSIDQCLDLLSGILNGEIELSQLDNGVEKIQKLQSKLKKFTNENVQSLLSMSEKDFRNSDLQKLVELLTDIRIFMVTQIIAQNDEETKQQQELVSNLRNLKVDHSNKMVQIASKTSLLNDTDEQIQFYTQLVQQNTDDCQGFQGDMDQENSFFVTVTSNYNALKRAYEEQLSICQQALRLIRSSGFPDYLRNINSYQTLSLQRFI